jgi:dTMP kinase
VVISAQQTEEALEQAIWEVVQQRFPELLRGSQA